MIYDLLQMRGNGGNFNFVFRINREIEKLEKELQNGVRASLVTNTPKRIEDSCNIRCETDVPNVSDSKEAQFYLEKVKQLDEDFNMIKDTYTQELTKVKEMMLRQKEREEEWENNRKLEIQREIEAKEREIENLTKLNVDNKMVPSNTKIKDESINSKLAKKKESIQKRISKTSTSRWI